MTTPDPSPIDSWHALLRPDVELSEPYWRELSSAMRGARLTFGAGSTARSCARSSCRRPTSRACAPWPRQSPVWASVSSRRAMADPALLDALGLNEDERRWWPSTRATSAPAPRRGSTRSCCPIRSSSPSTTRRRRPASATPRGCRSCSTGCPLMARFRDRFDTSYFRLTESLLEALLASYREWGGRADPPTILIPTGARCRRGTSSRSSSRASRRSACRRWWSSRSTWVSTGTTSGPPAGRSTSSTAAC